MTDYGPYKVHPLADALPLIEGEKFAAFVEDIRINGLGQAIILTHDQTTIVDGRNRYRACIEARVDPRFKPLPESFTDEQIADFIASENIHRRDLCTEDRLAWLDQYREFVADVRDRADDRRREGARLGGERSPHAATVSSKLEEPVPQARAPQSDDEIGRKIGLSGRTVRQYDRIKRDAPDLVPDIHARKISLKRADQEARVRVHEQRRREPVPEKARAEPILLTLRTHTGEKVGYPQSKSKSQFNQTSGPGISWAEWSWNPVTGCLHGCDYCYAREIATAARYAEAYPVGFTPLFHHERLDAPVNTVIPAQYRDDQHVSCGDGKCKVCAYRRVFVCSMADLYGRWVPDEWIDKVHTSMLTTPSWQYITLTKFPARYVGLEMPSNAWVGTSVDEQNRVRIAEEAFSKIDDVKVKWLSLEPLREPLEFADLSMFDWVVIGAQTATIQPGGRVPAFAPEFEWVARLVSQAREAGCKVHLKPNLQKDPGMQMPDEYPGENESGD